MILSSLCEYYGYLSRGGKALPEGYSDISITHIVSISPEGRVVGVVSQLTMEGKKKIYPTALFPKRTDKTATDANIVEHRPLYLFGLDANKEELVESDKAKKSHAAFVQKNVEFFEGLDHPLAKAFLEFVKNWDPSAETGNEHLLSIAKEYSQSHIAFTLEGRPDVMLQDLDEVQAKWEKISAAQQDEEEVVMAQCPIIGEELQVARVHDPIKSIKGGAVPDCKLVCFNNESANSYGKEQSFNSAISIKAMRQYTEALNYLLRHAEHRREVGDMVIVHFAMALDDSQYVGWINKEAFGGYDPESKDPIEIDDLDDEEMDGEGVTVATTEKEVGASIGNSVRGIKTEFDVRKDDSIAYCVFGFTKYDARLAVKFCYRDSFGLLRANVERYHQDFTIGDKPNNASIKQLCNSLLLKKKKDKDQKSKKGREDESKEDEKDKSSVGKVYNDYVNSFLNAVLNGAPIPVKILSRVVRQARTDLFVSDVRAGLIKACLVRKNNKYKEVIKMGLNKDNHDAAYLCGRLFAVLEKIQKDSVPGVKLNRTVKDTYFTSASATPAAIFARMVPLSQKHLAKIENEGAVRYLDNLVTDIINDIAAFPKTLSLEEQAEFILGYYQQNKDLYTKKTEKQEEN